MGSENFIEDLKPYGILARDAKRFKKWKTRIFISNAFIKEVDFKTLQEEGIKKLYVYGCEISNIKFSNQNDLRIYFVKCSFFDQVIASECSFEKEVYFSGAKFQNEASFNKATFRTIANFDKATFRTIANFNEAIFQKEANFDKATFRTIANFDKATFRTIANFDKATFQMRVIFNGAIFQDKVIFFNAKFLAKQEDNEIIENSFENVTFEKEVFFDGTSFQTIASFDGTSFQTIASFNGTSFQTIASFNRASFQNEVSFYKATFKDMVSFEEVSFQAKVSFNKSIFQDKVIFFNAKFLAEQEGNQIIKNSLKKKQIDFSNCQFLKEVDFKNNEFYEAYFKMSKFKDNVYFNNSYFKDYADFHECEFEKNACFYGVKFEKAPNFSQAIFKENLNAVNINLNFDFDDLKDKIKQEYDFYKKARVEKETGILYPEKSLDKFANDFRDSFRVLKNASIKDNNHLDASNFHKCELYCKEIELNFKKPKKFSKEWLDKYQLMFYRNLCDHHTDLILNLRWLIVTVGFFASILFVLRYGNGNLSKFFNIDIDLLKVLKNILNVKALNDSNAVYLIFMYSVIGLLFVRTFFILYYAVICFFYIATSSFNLFQIASFTFKSHKDCLENITIFLYIFCISLVVFSLQKTARKNSIVPS